MSPDIAGISKGRLRVGIVMPLAETRGGVEVMLMRLLRANRNVDGPEYCVVFLEDGPMVAEVLALGYPAIAIDAGRLRQPLYFVRAVRSIAGWFKKQGVAVLNCWMEKAHLYGAPAAFMLGIPCTWFVYSTPDGHWLNRAASVLPAECVFCCGEAVRKSQDRVWPFRKTRTIYVSVDTAQFNPERLPSPLQCRQQLGLPADGPLVGIVARLQRWKGVHVFLAAAGLLASKFPNISFAVVGGEHWAEPDYPGLLEEQASRLGIAQQTRFAGLQSNIPLWMQAMDVVVHASFDEPAGIVILEAMVLGKPVVCAKTDGPSEFLEDGIHGLAVKPGEPDQLAAAIERLLTDAPLRERCGKQALERGRLFDSARLARDMNLALCEAAGA